MSQQVDVEVNGVVIPRMSIIKSKYANTDAYSKQKIQEGDQIAYKPIKDLTEVQIKAIFGDKPLGRLTSLIMHWPLRQPEKPAGEFVPSKYQLDILDSFLNSDDHIQIPALAGSGKTSTLVWLLQELYKTGARNVRILYMAFNKAIQLELADRLKGTPYHVLTTHAFGLQILKRAFGKQLAFNGSKFGLIFLRRLCDLEGWNYSPDTINAAKKLPKYELKKAVKELVGYAKNWAVVPTYDGFWKFTAEQREFVTGLISIYEIEFDRDKFKIEDVVELALFVLSTSIPVPGESLTEFDYDDMIYMPLALNLQFPVYDIVLTDESQDFNACQIQMLEKLVKAKS